MDDNISNYPELYEPLLGGQLLLAQHLASERRAPPQPITRRQVNQCLKEIEDEHPLRELA